MISQPWKFIGSGFGLQQAAARVHSCSSASADGSIERTCSGTETGALVAPLDDDDSHHRQ
ncbi:hypothetical protein [Hydrocarboniphaga sp.]|uniref:hypothetical protein n=1 Tax=Hydrocarboniphaga sp. TaxID=2033016 RepID=UPI0026337A92|nr:hypothetical protein [Hydrocarboniphaga sp.]